MTVPVLLIDHVDVTEEIYGKHLTLRLNTLDVTLLDPASIPMLADDVECENPSWAGTVASVTVEDKDLRDGHLWVKVTATNSDEAVAAPAPFGLSDEPSDAPSFAQLMTDSVPVGYWRLGEPSGTTATDEMGANNGTYVNTPTLGVASLLSGDADTAVTLTRASSEHVDTAAPVTTVVDNWTIAAWVKPTASATTRNIFYNGSAGDGYGLFLTTAHKLWGYAEGFGNLTNGTASSVLSTSVASFAVLVRRSGTTYIYLNGVLDDTGGTGTPVTPTSMTSIGSENGAAHYFDGTIDEPAIWNRALSATEIADLYAAAQLSGTYGYRKLVVTRTRYEGSEETRATLETFTPGLLPGMTLELTSANLNLDAADFTITDVHVSWLRDDTPLFTLSLGDAIVTMSVWLASDAIPDGSISGTKITDGSIDTPQLAANAVTAAKIAAGTITADEIAANTITAAEINSELSYEGKIVFIGGTATGKGTIDDVPGTAFLRISTDGSADPMGVQIESTSGESNFLNLGVDGESANRLQLEGDATLTALQMGPGTSGYDVYLRRSAADTLTIDDGAGGALTLVDIKAGIKLNLPTSNPGAGLLWNNAGTVKVGT